MFELNSPPRHLDEAFATLFQSGGLDAPGRAYESELFAAASAPNLAFIAPQAAQKSTPDNAEIAALANGGATFHPDEIAPRDDLRESPSARWRLKSSVVRILKSDVAPDQRSYSVCGCGHAAKKMVDGELETVDSVRLYRRGEGEKPSVTVAGTLKCQSPWLCPSCAPSRALKRKNRVLEVVEHTEAMGGISAFVTLTVSHTREMPLQHVKHILSTASRKARQGKGWKKIEAQGGVLGVVQGIEVLHNKRTGWHYHAHLLVPCLGDAASVRQAMRDLVARYMRQVRKLGGTAKKIGQDVQIVRDTEEDAERISKYASKGSASWEIAGGLKSARERESRTPWDLAQLANAGDAEAKGLFLEYAECIVGTRSCVVSAALAKKLHLQPENDDDDKAEYVLDEEHAPVIEILTERWRKLMSYGLAWRVIGAVEQGQETAAVEQVVSDLIHGIDCREARSRYESKPKPAKVDARSLASSIVSKRQAGYSWRQAEKAAVSDVKKTFKVFGQEYELPDTDELGRAISYEMIDLWGG